MSKGMPPSYIPPYQYRSYECITPTIPNNIIDSTNGCTPTNDFLNLTTKYYSSSKNINISSLRESLMYGPVAAVLQAPSGLGRYKGGVYDGC
jgi:hypothetical protein